MKIIKHIFYGDSITLCEEIDQKKRWVNEIDVNINNKFVNHNYQTLNKGVSGETSRQALNRVQTDMQDLLPDILSIQFGANDSDCWISNKGLPCVSPGSFYENLKEIIFRAKHFDVRKIFIHTNHLFLKKRVEYNNLPHNDTLISYNQIIRDVAKETESELIDIEKYFFNLDAEYYCQSLPDGVHLNNQGSKEYFKLISKHVEKYLISQIKDYE